MIYAADKDGILGEGVLNAIVDLYLWQIRKDSMYSFTDMLFILFQKSDHVKKARLRLGFPDHYVAYEMWYHHQNQDDFFKKYIVVNHQ